MKRWWILALFALAPVLAQVNVTFWHSMDGPAGEAIDRFAERFNAAQSDYRVVPRYVGDYREAETKLIAALRTGSAPVLYQAEIAFFPRLVAEGTVRPLDAFTAGLDPEFVADFYAAPWNYGVVDGVRYGLPFNTSTPVLFYNADALRTLRLPVPGDWKTFEDDALKLTTRRSKGFIAILDSWIFEAMVTSRGGSLVTADGRPNFASPEAVDALAMLRRLVDKKAAIPRNLAESQFAQLDFVRTKGMMVFASIANWPAAEKYSFAFELGVAPVPHEPGGKVPMGGAELVVLKSASDEEAAGAFAFWKFLMQPENLVEWIHASYYVPLRRSVLPLLEDFYAENPYRKVAFEQIARAVPRPRVPQFAVWRDYLDEALEKALKGRTDPRQALEEAQKKALEVR
ncbi:carbohydrate ABC transporter substrate-binding protein, CUT1 family [Oceanithermus profundus DSM 14977]|uniref:Carbohydrate ABC transporter substrate-binding protein, CUT1 family n=1 Tax=Oceanithermus profundus (strain DSM 14977 / NBRC 100410 / VKM B-2274 / 506) TaxID=670487 RepID=E4U6E3_OCEP5|nr:ABC transporter substrate-binding protein [Oceanithermus profundus]ADR35563.1 carbohydrate ABC transporter substrate-binding protein, CUT1 family [Oceanithermus profundus DSM 14977]